MRSRILVALAVLLALPLIWPATPVLAQVGFVSGTVTDADGNPIKGATIRVEELDGGRKYKLKTDKKGYYLHAGIQTGNYRVICEAEGFRPDYVQPVRPGHARDSELRNFLGGFNFSGDAALSPVAPFSGGEKSRLALALLIWQRPNLLLLDEPTNHLDLEMRHALTLALQDYEGALVVVSHDRHLLRATTDDFLLAANGAVVPFDGDLDDYRRWRSEQAAADASAGKGNEPQEMDRKARKRLEAEERNRLAVLRKPIEDKIRKLERDMEALTKEKETLDSLLAAPDMYENENKEALRETLMKQARVAEQLHQVEEYWLERTDALEALSRSD